MPDVESLDGLDGLVLDLDGVVYRGDSIIPGAAEAIEKMRAVGFPLVFATNNATKTPDAYAQKLAHLGIRAASAEVVTSAVVTAEEIARRGWAGRTAFLIGSSGAREALSTAGLLLVEGDAGKSAEIVISSADPDFTYDKLRTAGLALHQGAEFIATNGDATFPASDGLWPGAGSILAAVETVAGRRAEVMGKPHLPMMKAIERRLPGCDRIGMIGDQPATDLDGARAMGWRTILVLSGVTGAEAIEGLRPPPDLVVDSLSALSL